MINYSNINVGFAFVPEDCDWCHALADGRLHHPGYPHACPDCLTALPASRPYRRSGGSTDLPGHPVRAAA